MTTMNSPLPEQVFIKNQTKLIIKLLENEIILFDEIENDIDENDEYIDVHTWLLIDNYYKEKVKEMKITYIEYENNLWVGMSHYGTRWENTCYWDVFK